MKKLKLRIEERLDSIAEKIIDWFMALFADPDYYWIEEIHLANNTINCDSNEREPQKSKIRILINSVKATLKMIPIEVRVKPITNKNDKLKLNEAWINKLNKFVLSLVFPQLE